MILDRIVEVKKQEVEALRRNLELPEWRARAMEMPPTRGFGKALEKGKEAKLIAEVKKASPSKGLIRGDFNPAQIAKDYERGGAHAVSVLTDIPFFQGSNAYLTEVKESVALPVLRKDFLIDERQIYEARLIGADAVLLIVAILSKAQLQHYLGVANELSLAALVEVHDEQELDTALASRAPIIGINNRDLRDFTVSLETTISLASIIPSDVTLVSESGIVTHDDVKQVVQAGASAVLVGESLMRSDNLAAAVQQLLGRVS